MLVHKRSGIDPISELENVPVWRLQGRIPSLSGIAACPFSSSDVVRIPGSDTFLAAFFHGCRTSAGTTVFRSLDCRHPEPVSVLVTNLAAFALTGRFTRTRTCLGISKICRGAPSVCGKADAVSEPTTLRPSGGKGPVATVLCRVIGMPAAAGSAGSRRNMHAEDQGPGIDACQ